ncbi:DUF1803 domain-containing protein [Enterococcus larvae]|uniref:DUF1803 domain-containing protein n=1 Tax=Enterococcus larvae TaxID=2794352 RepID=UPI003F40C30C
MTTMYYFQHKQQKKLEKLVKNPLFHQIVAYFNEHQKEETILRELKKAFQERNFERFLEEMIDFELIRREDRRYYLEIPFFEADAIEQVQESAQLFVQKNTGLEPNLFYGEIVWKQLFESEEDYFFGVHYKEEMKPQLFFVKEQCGNDQLQFVSIHPKENAALDFPTYFAMMEETSGENIPEVFQPLQELIGDVDSQYFAAQSYRIIRAVLKNRRIADKRNIFLEALVLTDELARTEEGWQLKLPIIQNQQIEEMDLTNDLVYYNQIEDSNQRVFNKFQFYQHCLSVVMGENESLSYLII